MTKFLVLLLLITGPLWITSAIDQHEIRIGVVYDMHAMNLLAGKGSLLGMADKIGSIMKRVNEKTRMRGVTTIVFHQIFTPSVIPSNLDESLSSLEESIHVGFIFGKEVDFLQTWTGLAFPNEKRQYIAAENKTCGLHANAVIRVVDNKNKIYREAIIAHLVLKALTINMGMTDKTLKCKCAGKCVTNSNTGPGMFYMDLPFCASQFMDEKLSHPSCVHEPSNGTVNPVYGVRICGNGVQETIQKLILDPDVEECDCRLGNTTCESCCDWKLCRHNCTNANPAVVQSPVENPKPDPKRGTGTDPRKDPPVKSTTTEPKTESNKSSHAYVIPVVAGVVVGLLVLIGLVGCVVYMKRKKRAESQSTSSSASNATGTPKSLPAVFKKRPLKYELAGASIDRTRSRSPQAVSP